MTFRPVVAAMVALSLAAGAGAWHHLRADRERVESLERDVAALRDAANAASSERSALADQIARLEAALAAATAGDSAVRAERTPTTPPPRGASAPADDGVATAQPTPDAPADHEAITGGVMGSFDADRLVAAGFRRADVDRFRARIDEIEMKRLYLHDQATREGWIDTPRFAQESASLFGELVGLRSEFDEPLYDWVLFSTGHPNRVAVREVISGSAGESAGLLRGDVIVRYDDRLVLSADELRSATTQGRAGELVAVEVQREGETAARRIFVPRGPIGITLAPTALQPAPAG